MQKPVLQGSSHPSGFAWVAEDSPGICSDHFLTSLSCWTSWGAHSAKGIAAAPCLSPVCHGRLSAGAWEKWERSLRFPLYYSYWLPLFPLSLQQKFLLLDPPSSTLSWARSTQLGKDACVFLKGTDPAHWALMPSGELSDTLFWGGRWFPHPGV